MSEIAVDQAPPGFRRLFAVGEFRALFGLQALQAGGDQVRVLALSVLVYGRTGSPFQAALVLCAGMLPYVLGGALLLSLADRWPARRLLTGVHGARAVVAALLALTLPPLPVALALVLLLGLVAPLGAAASQAVLPEVLPGGGFVLGRSLFIMSAGAAQIVGQGGGGALLVLIGPRGALWTAAALGVIGTVLARFGLRGRPARAAGTGGTVRGTWRGNREVLGDPALRGALLAAVLPISLAVAAEGVVIPYTAGAGHPAAAGPIFAAAAGGMLLGNLLVGRFAKGARLSRLALPLAVLTGVALLPLTLAPGTPVAAALMGLSAVGLSYELAVQNRFVDLVPERLRGQGLGLVGTGQMTGQALGMAAAGALAEVWSPGTVMALCGAGAVAVSLALARHVR
ncbi:MFS transporter [Actinomadura parmotrematis]|uniref:MFS transporter n=1 Tax=Actinomadura parmotrematis TaxID=2864039 RepID=A0ABS7G1M6_9ACTN|nr:MFS transporter [Actinomadura parmotrematis]MBW8485784.1 MFS transporter [Actinomadura parmotrematis]